MNQFFYFPDWVIADFLRKDARSMSTKDYEFVSAIITSRMCRQQWNEPCEIGFPVKPDAYRSANDSERLDIDGLVQALRKSSEEDSPIDYAIRSRVIPLDGSPRRGVYVQVKRFGIGRENPDTDELIEYLNGLIYQPLPITLIVFLETGNELEPRRVQAAIDPASFPFERLILVAKSGRTMRFMSMFPESGMEEYDIEELLT